MEGGGDKLLQDGTQINKKNPEGFSLAPYLRSDLSHMVYDGRHRQDV